MTLRPHLTLAAVLLLFLGCTPKIGPAVSARPSAKLLGGTAGCNQPAPTTPAGYAALWETVPDSEWGGGDLGISAPLPDGRDVWVYADSWRPGAAGGNYFVHSVALVQNQGCVHASHAGQQLIPNTDAAHIFWPYAVRWVAPYVRVTARAITLTGTSGWAFKDGGYTRNYYYTITAAGDLTLATAGTRYYISAPDPGPFYNADGTINTNPDLDGHYFYSKHTHPEAKLASGRTLVTLAQGWGDGQWHYVPSWKACNAPIWIMS